MTAGPAGRAVPLHAVRRGAEVTVEHVSKCYDGRITALREVDLHLRPGEFVALTGPSGSGKSTLLQIIGRLDRPDSGRIVVDGISVGDLRNPHRVPPRRGRLRLPAPSPASHAERPGQRRGAAGRGRGLARRAARAQPRAALRGVPGAPRGRAALPALGRRAPAGGGGARARQRAAAAARRRAHRLARPGRQRPACSTSSRRCASAGG